MAMTVEKVSGGRRLGFSGGVGADVCRRGKSQCGSWAVAWGMGGELCPSLTRGGRKGGGIQEKEVWLRSELFEVLWASE